MLSSFSEKNSKIRFFIVFIFFLSVISGWIYYMVYYHQWSLFKENWFMSLTMVFGSFVAGASSEGGGAIAFPAMTLAFKIPPDIARNFSLAIQSIGMTAAALIIFFRRIPVEKNYLIFGSIGGFIGIIFGTIYIAPLVPPKFAKMMFVSFWVSFASILFFVNHVKNRKVVDSLPHLAKNELFIIILIGMMGGTLSSILGSGIDIFTFSYITLRYKLSEKVATPTSVVLMAGNAIVGFALHSLVLNDFGVTEFNFWMVSIPVVIIGAPMGAYFMSKKTRFFIVDFLYIVILFQFVAAIFIIKPTGKLLLFSFLIFIFGIVFFLIVGVFSSDEKFFKRHEFIDFFIKLKNQFLGIFTSSKNKTKKNSSLRRKMVFYFLLVAFANVFVGLELLREIHSDKYQLEIRKDVQLIKEGKKDIDYIHRDLIILSNKFIVMVSILILISAVVLFMFVRQIASPIQYMIDKSKKIAEGDLSETIEIKSGDELSQLGNLINDLTANIQEIIAQLEYVFESLNESNKHLKTKFDLFPEIKPYFEEEEKQMSEALGTVSLLIESFTLFKMQEQEMNSHQEKKGSKMLGDILLENNEITSEQLQEALSFQTKHGGFLGQIFVHLKIVTEDVLAKYIDIQKNTEELS